MQTIWSRRRVAIDTSRERKSTQRAWLLWCHVVLITGSSLRTGLCVITSSDILCALYLNFELSYEPASDA